MVNKTRSVSVARQGFSDRKVPVNMAGSFPEICRLCLEEIKSPSTTLKEGGSLLMKIKRISPVVKIHPGDGLPTLVCNQCESLVNICYNFKLQMERSDVALQKYCSSSQQGHPIFPQSFIMRKEDNITVDHNSPDSGDMPGGSSVYHPESLAGTHLLAPLVVVGSIAHQSDKHSLSPDSHHSKSSSDNITEPSQNHDHYKKHDGNGTAIECDCVKKYKPRLFSSAHSDNGKDSAKPYICAYCGQSFRYMSSLSRHLVIHSGEKRYVCPVCNKAFTQDAHLKTHSRLHTGEKPYHCPECHMAFSRKGNLKRHQLVHKEDKVLIN